MAKKVKLDKDKMKQFLREKVERVALGVTGTIAVLLLLVGLVAAFGAKSPDGEIRNINNSLQSKLNSDAVDLPNDGEDDKGKTKAPSLPVDWPVTRLDAFPEVAWYNPGETHDPKKRNPPALPILVFNPTTKERYCQVTWNHAYFAYDINPRKAQITVVKSSDNKTVKGPAEFVRMEHMAVVEALFPYREQVRAFLKPLRIEKYDDLLAKGLAPRFDGLNVYRGEVLPGGKVDWKPVYLHDKNDKVILSPRVEALLKDGVPDQTRNEQYQQALVRSGGDTPLPKPLSREYPPLVLAGLTLKEIQRPDETPGEGPGQGVQVPGVPKGVAGNINIPGAYKEKMANQPQVQVAEGGKLGTAALKTFKTLRNWVSGKKFDPFNPYGAPPDDSANAGQAMPGFIPGGKPGFPGIPPGMPRPGIKPVAKDTEEEPAGGTSTDQLDGLPEKVVVRFVDAGLEPGKTYQYYVQVRLKNPNFGKTKEVAFEAMARQKSLESPWVLTPPVYVPKTFHFYVFNQYPLVTSSKVTGTRSIPKEGVLIERGKIPFQIHQLVYESSPVSAGEISRKVCDWVIAERLFFGRGELLMRRGLELEFGFWVPEASTFQMGEFVTTGKGKFAKTVRKSALPVDLGDESSPVLVDFWGLKHRFEGKSETVMVDALMLMGDGRLVVHNSHDDADPDNPENPSGMERQQRYEAWKTRLQRLRATASAGSAGSGAGAMPGVPPGINIPKGPGR